MDEYFELIKEKFSGYFSDNKEQIKKIVAVGLLVVVGFVVFAMLKGNEEEKILDKTGEISVEESKEEVASASIFVDVGGQVKTPLLVELPENSRVEDAIIAAGGLTGDADMSSINRAEILVDGQKVYIPSANEGAIENVYGNSASGGKVSINSAESDQLQTLTGVGPVTAEKIIQYRTENGRFSKLEDLKKVPGIGDKTFDKLKDKITL